MNRRRWQDHIAFIVGIWLISSPWAFGRFSPASMPMGSAAWNFLVCGTAIAILGLAALASYRFWEEWVNLLIGAWLVASPWILQYVQEPLLVWNAFICGILLVVLGVWALRGANLSERH